MIFQKYDLDSSNLDHISVFLNLLNTIIMYKKCNIFMLQTEDQLAPITLGDNLLVNLPGVFRGSKFHLYISSDLSSLEIKEGNWYENNNVLFKADDKFDKGNNPNVNDRNKIIIATTDSSMEILFKINKKLQRTFKFAFPSQSFVNKFINEYNTGNIITEVMVEHETHNNEDRYGETIKMHYPKINSDGTITIKTIKDTWSREEVIALYNEYLLECLDDDGDYSMTYDTWLKDRI